MVCGQGPGTQGAKDSAGTAEGRAPTKLLHASRRMQVSNSSVPLTFKTGFGWPSGAPCVDGNYWPAWVEAASDTYRVLVLWPKTLWQQYKLSHSTYEDYLPLCRQNFFAEKRNLDMVRACMDEKRIDAKIVENTKRIRSNPEVYSGPCVFGSQFTPIFHGD